MILVIVQFNVLIEAVSRWLLFIQIGPMQMFELYKEIPGALFIPSSKK